MCTADRVYEEKRRCDVAMVAARAAQQAQRDANAASRGLALLGCPWRSDCKPASVVLLRLGICILLVFCMSVVLFLGQCVPELAAATIGSCWCLSRANLS